MLTLWRRHLKNCKHRDGGRAYTKCSCPIWCDGEVNGARVRKSMDTRDWARAARNLGKIEDPTHGLRLCQQPGCDSLVEAGRCPRHSRALGLAVGAYHQAHQDVRPETVRHRKRSLRLLEEFLRNRGIATVDAIGLDDLNAFRDARKVGARTWVKELSNIRHFLRHCVRNEWVLRNWAEMVQMPRGLAPAEREPYEPNEIARIIAACDRIGRTPYERLRARAMVLLMRFTALRISDVATLKRDRIRNGEIFIRAAKNGRPVRLPVPPELQAALDALPTPRGAAADCPYFFWTGNGKTTAVTGAAKRSLSAVFRASGVAEACPHRFRHTLATEVLEMGGTFEEAADILGDSEAIIRKHYAKWSAGRQVRISDLLARIWHAKNWKLEVIENNDDTLGRLVGFEPTTFRTTI
jgi:integrase